MSKSTHYVRLAESRPGFRGFYTTRARAVCGWRGRIRVAQPEHLDEVTCGRCRRTFAFKLADGTAGYW